MTGFASNAWFAGFIDGEGCFTHDSTGTPPKPRGVFHLAQKDPTILHRLQAEFGGNVVVARRVAALDDGVRNRHGSRPYVRGGVPSAYRLVLNGPNDLERLVAYLERFPLQTPLKVGQFVAWCQQWGFGSKQSKAA